MRAGRCLGGDGRGGGAGCSDYRQGHKRGWWGRGREEATPLHVGCVAAACVGRLRNPCGIEGPELGGEAGALGAAAWVASLCRGCCKATYFHSQYGLP